MYHKIPLLVAGIFILCLWLAAAFTDNPINNGTWDNAPAKTSPRTIILTPDRRTHILYGDHRGGGHFHTANKPCKSEFPEDWTEDKIISVLRDIAANDNLNWRKADNGYHTAEQKIDHVRIRVVLSEDKSRIITGYPVNLPRNPCPKAANDNDNRNR